MADVESRADQGRLTPSAPQDASDPVIASERGSQGAGNGIQDRAVDEQKRLLGWSVPDHIGILDQDGDVVLICAKDAEHPVRLTRPSLNCRKALTAETYADGAIDFLKRHSHGQSVEYRPALTVPEKPIAASLASDPWQASEPPSENYLGGPALCTSVLASHRCELGVGHDGQHRRYVGPREPWELWDDAAPVEYRPDTEAAEAKPWMADRSAADSDTDSLEEARCWARHGYEIGQRSCTWSDQGVAPKWLTGWHNPAALASEPAPVSALVPSPVPSSALPAPEDAQKAGEGVSEPLSVRLVRAAHDVLGNDTKNVLDCSTAEVIAAVLRELAAAEQTFGVGTLEDLADKIEESAR